ncbi:MAG: hypothetical protein AAFY73_07955 [Pseudomonadota bacterium]
MAGDRRKAARFHEPFERLMVPRFCVGFPWVFAFKFPGSHIPLLDGFQALSFLDLCGSVERPHGKHLFFLSLCSYFVLNCESEFWSEQKFFQVL